jgi:hypothetical protein
LKRAENLKLKRLLASNHLAMAKFELTVKWFSPTLIFFIILFVLFLYESRHLAYSSNLSPMIMWNHCCLVGIRMLVS